MTLTSLIKELRERQRRRDGGGNPTEPSAHWPGEDIVPGGDLLTSYTVILRTRGCRLAQAAGCSMCGYPNEGTEGIGTDEILTQLDTALASAPNDDLYLKIFTSGSLLDPWELPQEAQDATIDRLRNDDRITRLSVETLPRFVTEENMERLRGDWDLEIATGLETSNDQIRRTCLNKNLTFTDYQDAVKTAKENDVDVKTYLLLKPPFLPEPTALTDAVQSGIDALDAGTDTVSLNLCTVQKGTLVDHLYRRGEYRPPWLWTAHETVRRIKKHAKKRPVISDPVAAGTRRGPRNCGDCDDLAAQALDIFTKNQDPTILDEVTCNCKKEWQERLLLEERLHHPAPLTDL